MSKNKFQKSYYRRKIISKREHEKEDELREECQNEKKKKQYTKHASRVGQTRDMAVKEKEKEWKETMHVKGKSRRGGWIGEKKCVEVCLWVRPVEGEVQEQGKGENGREE